MKLSKIFLAILALMTVVVCQSGVSQKNVSALAKRTVIDNERGFYYVSPYDGDWSKVGAYIGLAHYNTFAAMNREAIAGIHGRFQHFHADDVNRYAYFPYNELKKYETDELARGRPPLWITATYNGQKRPVIFEWLSKEKAQAVNFTDERYINFFINKYVRQKLQKQTYQNLWLGLDNCAFKYELYGVFDAQGRFVNNIKWDEPFPQNDREFLQAGKYFFKRLKELAPDIKTICNEGSVSDESQYNEVFANTDGVILENFLGEIYGSDGDYVRLKYYRSYQRMKNFAANKVQIYQPRLDKPEKTISSMYLAYLIFAGENRFFSPYKNDSEEIDPKQYAEIKNTLGAPTAEAKDEKEPGKGDGYRLYSRACEGGIAYFNLTGKTQTINLPSGKQYFDRDGNLVTRISIKDKEAKYVLFTPGARVAKPAINPVRPSTVNGSVAVTLSTTTPGATIRYTLDNSEPNKNSPIYTSPIKLTSNVTVKAKAFSLNARESFVSAAAYKITNQIPSAEFHLSSASGSEFINVDYPLVKLSNPSAEPVTINYSVTGGTASVDVDYKMVTGTLTFMPGEIYKYFPIAIINDNKAENNETIKVTLSSAKNSTLGSNKSYTYTINDND
ncbi:chitobiase/beta-hexosaminidase C-terminal domain-containing protein [Calothrix sp. NIES-2098]|uniref:chitobiase/beta-hexosaminidase C-terminal domain-containing protein n=1 Tax=Calothrix sp. NIES-2098 TaxID=1954171 RepID=UPI000B5E13CC|nr:hypothetical protein NIES2098_02410 [Calothrix sp. NIES-2098]